MKRLLLGSTIFLILGGRALAADFAPVPEPVDLYNWTGFYIGLAAGGAAGTSNFHIRDCYELCGIQHEPDGIVAGGQAGALYQMGNLVIGAEVQGLWMDARDTEPFLFGLVDTESHLGPLVTAKGQVGLAWDRAYIYGTAGWATAEARAEANIPIIGAHWEDKQWADGFVYGAGFKYAVVDNGGGTMPGSVIVGVEWNHIDLGSTDFDGPIHFGGGQVYSLSQECRMCGQPKLKVGNDLDFDVVTANIAVKF